MRRRDVLGLIAGAALPWPYPTRASQALLDDSVGFTGQILFLSVKTPALVLGVVRNGQTSIQGFGRRAADASEPPAADTLFRIGSITKAFTGQLLASLAADGVVSLADPLTKYVPEFVAPMSEGGRPIRLIDLATHSAGLPREVPHAPGPPDDPFVNVTHDAFVAWLKANPLMFTPGTSISYSNFGFDLLAAALAAAAHQPYPDLLDARVIRPLGLRDTTFAPSASQAARVMPGHDFDGSPLPNAATGSVIVGSGGLYSSPRDLLAWLEWHLDRFSKRTRRRTAHRPRRLSVARRAQRRFRDGRIRTYGRDGARLGHHGARGRSAAHPAEGGRASGRVFLCRLRAGARDRRLRRRQRVRRRRRFGDGEGRQRSHRRACAALTGDQSSGTSALRRPSRMRSRWAR